MVCWHYLNILKWQGTLDLQWQMRIYVLLTIDKIALVSLSKAQVSRNFVKWYSHLEVSIWLLREVFKTKTYIQETLSNALMKWWFLLQIYFSQNKILFCSPSCALSIDTKFASNFLNIWVRVTIQSATLHNVIILIFCPSFLGLSTW